MEILREEEYTYQTYFQLLTFNQIQLLKAIAKEGIVREVNAAAFIKKYDLKAVSSVNTSLRILIDKEFILRQPDGYIVYDITMGLSSSANFWRSSLYNSSLSFELTNKK